MGIKTVNVQALFITIITAYIIENRLERQAILQLKNNKVSDTLEHQPTVNAGMESCFGLDRPPQHGIAIGQTTYFLPDGYVMLMRPNKAETGVHGCHCPGDMAVRMRQVLARPWVGVRGCHFLLL